MKTIKTNLLKKSKNGVGGKYTITLEVNDKDIEMLEDFATTYTPFLLSEKIDRRDFDALNVLKLKSPLYKLVKEFLKIWKKYDKQ